MKDAPPVGTRMLNARTGGEGAKAKNMGNSRMMRVLVPAAATDRERRRAERIAEALRCLGLSAGLAAWDDPSLADASVCFLVSIAGFIGTMGALEKLRALRQQGTTLVCCSFGPVQGPEYAHTRELCATAGIDTILDIGLHDQRDYLPTAARTSYHFAFAGLLPGEVQRCEMPPTDDRPLPWSLIGLTTPFRAALIDYLVQHIDPRGYVYFPGPAEPSGSSSPHLQPEQFQAVLQRTRFHVWCAKHYHDHLDAERFRLSLVSGCVPMQVFVTRDKPAGIPFPYLTAHVTELPELLRPERFAELRRRFVDDYRRLPMLPAALREFLIGRELMQPVYRRWKSKVTATSVAHYRQAG
jgi:hypothetical protein